MGKTLLMFFKYHTIVQYPLIAWQNLKLWFLNDEKIMVNFVSVELQLEITVLFDRVWKQNTLFKKN